MGRRRCCCGCEIGSDDFNRDDSTTLGTLWPDTIEGNTAQTGDWDIADNTATENDGAGRAIFHKRHPRPDESMIVQIWLPDIQLDDKYEVILNWLDFDNYHYAQVEAVTENPTGELWMVLRLYVVSEGVETLLSEISIGRVFPDPITELRQGALHAKIGREGFCARLSTAEVFLVWETTTLIPEGYWAGMGASGREGIAIDDFEFAEHLETNPLCPWCICKCNRKPLPKKLKATIVDCTGRMTAAEGCEIDLDWQQDEIGYTPTFSGWYGIAPCCGVNGSIDVQLLCGYDQTVETMQATVPSTCNTLAESLFTAEGSTCDPIFFRFGPFSASSGDLICGCGQPMVDPDGQFWIEITE